MILRYVFFCIVMTIPVQMHAMQQLQKSFQEIMYTITPASGNPLTWFGNNFHAVQENLAYRSKTMSESDLEWYIKKHDPAIKTIINLREADGIWFEKEQAVATRNNVQLRTITLDSQKLPTRQQLQDIFNLFQTAPKPILFHCQAGVDRTSLVAAFWKLMMQNGTLDQALEQMTPSYGHFEWSRPLMRRCIALLDATRGADGKINLENYDPDEAIKKISLSSLPIRAAKSLALTAKNNPKKTASILSLGAVASVLLYNFFKK